MRLAALVFVLSLWVAHEKHREVLASSEHNQTLDQLNSTRNDDLLKFALLATGDQIKFIPFDGHDRLNSQLIYIIKPKPYNGRLDSGFIPRSNFSRMVEENRIRSTRAQEDKISNRKPILPMEIDKIDDAFTKATGWRQPLITDLDYVFDERFCDAGKGSLCLVIIWHDAANNILRRCSIDMSAHKLTRNNTDSELEPSIIHAKSPKHQRYLECDEYKPFIPNALLSPNIGVIQSFAVDRSTKKLFVAGARNTSDGLVQYFVSGFLDTSTHDYPNLKYPLVNDTAIWAKTCDKQPRNTPLQTMIETNRKWVFQYDTYMNDFYAFEMSASGVDWNRAFLSPRKAFTDPRSMWIDQQNQRLMLMRFNGIYSYDYAFRDLRYYGDLCIKPRMDSQGLFRMHMYKQRVFFSDMVMKSLVAYDLPSESISTDDPRYNFTCDSDLHKSRIKTIHVDMHSIYGFKIVDLETYYVENSSYGVHINKVGGSDPPPPDPCGCSINRDPIAVLRSKFTPNWSCKWGQDPEELAELKRQSDIAGAVSIVMVLLLCFFVLMLRGLQHHRGVSKDGDQKSVQDNKSSMDKAMLAS